LLKIGQIAENNYHNIDPQETEIKLCGDAGRTVTSSLVVLAGLIVAAMFRPQSCL
jgi:hypothetical protein